MIGQRVHWSVRVCGPQSLLEGRARTKYIYFIHYFVFFFMDNAGGLCWLWLWEQAPCSYSFSSRLHDGCCSPALTFDLHLKELEEMSLSHNTIRVTNVIYVYFHILSQCIILKCVQYIQYSRCFMGEQLQGVLQLLNGTVLYNKLELYCLKANFKTRWQSNQIKIN